MKMGVAGTFFEPHLWNSENLLLFSRCTNHITIIFWSILLSKSCKKMLKPSSPGVQSFLDNGTMHILHCLMKIIILCFEQKSDVLSSFTNWIQHLVHKLKHISFFYLLLTFISFQKIWDVSINKAKKLLHLWNDKIHCQ